MEALPLQPELHPGVGFVQRHHLVDTFHPSVIGLSLTRGKKPGSKTLDLLGDLEVLGGVSPLGGQDVASWAGQRVPDEEVSVTLHEVLCDLQQHTGMTYQHTHSHTHEVCFHSKHLIQADGGRLFLLPTGTCIHLLYRDELKLKKNI